MTRSARRVALVFCISGALASPTAAQIRDVREEPLTAADGTAFTVTRGVVRVSESREGPASSATLDLAVVRVRRAGSAPRSVHVVLAGGPGDSGVNLALGIASRGGALLADIMDGDVVGIDQRGSGMSLPNLSSPQLYDLPLEGAASPDAWLPQMARAARNVADTFRQRGIRLDAYNTRESADDVRDVCRSLGYEKATLWGRSYGTHLALAVLARHPDMVERLVLVGPEGANHTWKLPSQVDTVLERVAESAQTPSLVIDMRRVIAGLAATPVTADISHPATGRPARVTIGSFDVQWVVSQALGDPRMLATLPAAFREMSAGNFQRVAPILLLRRSRLGVESAMKHVMDASSGATADRFERIERESSTAVLGNAINFPGMFLRHAWGAADLGDDFRRPIRSEVPALILAGDLDPRTPVENAREIAATLPNAQVVVIENATHQFDFFGQPAIRAVLGQFLRGGRVANRVALPPIEFQR